jgi:hypothetical protein
MTTELKEAHREVDAKHAAWLKANEAARQALDELHAAESRVFSLIVARS